MQNSLQPPVTTSAGVVPRAAAVAFTWRMIAGERTTLCGALRRLGMFGVYPMYGSLARGLGRAATDCDVAIFPGRGESVEGVTEFVGQSGDDSRVLFKLWGSGDPPRLDAFFADKGGSAVSLEGE